MPEGKPNKRCTAGNVHDSVAFHSLYDRLKEKRGMGYAQYRALAQAGEWVRLKFAAIYLKKAGNVAVE